jgi:hypothetical protein
MAIIYKLNNWTKWILYWEDHNLLPKNTDYYTYRNIENKELEKIRDLTWDKVQVLLDRYI